MSLRPSSDTTAVITTEEFTANASGYRDLLVWADAHSNPSSRAWSVEGTRSYGAGATLTLEEAHEWVIEFDRPANAASKDRAKTDTLDAIRAAREALGRHKVATPRSSGKRSQLQALKVARDSAQRARVAAIKQLRALIVTSPVELRDELRSLTLAKLIDRASRLRPSGDNAGIKTALRTLARRVRNLDQEIKDLDALIKELIDELAPQLLDEVGISYTTAAQILLSWSHSEAAFARLAGVAPNPAHPRSTRKPDNNPLRNGLVHHLSNPASVAKAVRTLRARPAKRRFRSATDAQVSARHSPGHRQDTLRTPWCGWVSSEVFVRVDMAKTEHDTHALTIDGVGMSTGRSATTGL